MVRLVELTEDIKRDRKDRIEQIQWERKDPRLPEPERVYDAPRALPALEGPPPPAELRRGDWDERIYEREVVYEDGSRRRYRG